MKVRQNQGKDFQINNIQFQGNFYMPKKFRPDPKKGYVHKVNISGNILVVTLNANFFRWQVSNCINEYVVQTNVAQFVRQEIEDLIWRLDPNPPTKKKKVQISPDKIAARVTNYQCSCTFKDCSLKQLSGSVIPAFCDKFGIKIVEVGQEDQIAAPTRVENIRGKDNTYSCFLCKKEDVSVKFQPNARQKLVHVTFIATTYTKLVKRVISYLKELLNYFNGERQRAPPAPPQPHRPWIKGILKTQK